MTASAPSNTALATSDTSARVGTGAVIIDSSIWVATTTGLPKRRAIRTMLFCTPGTRSSGISTPRSPRATISASATSRISSSRVTACGFSILASTDARPAGDLLDLGHVLGPLHERHRDPVDVLVERSVEIGAILRRHRRSRDGGVRQADPLLVGDLAGDFDDAIGAARRHRGDAQQDLAIVDQHPMSGLHASRGSPDEADRRARRCPASNRHRA